MYNIDLELSGMPEPKRRNFVRTMADVLEDGFWCMRHGIDYENPNMRAVKRELFYEMFVTGLNPI